MKYVVKEVGELVEVRDGALTLEKMRKIVGGYIEPFYVGDYCMIGNEEAKLQDMKPNVAMNLEDTIFDTMNGTIIVVRNGREDFEELSEADVEKVKKLFNMPEEQFVAHDTRTGEQWIIPIVEV